METILGTLMRRYHIIKMNLKKMRDGAEWILLATDKARCTVGVFTLNVNVHRRK
jgi:hypothetical protein